MYSGVTSPVKYGGSVSGSGPADGYYGYTGGAVPGDLGADSPPYSSYPAGGEGVGVAEAEL